MKEFRLVFEAPYVVCTTKVYVDLSYMFWRVYQKDDLIKGRVPKKVGNYPLFVDKGPPRPPYST